MGDAKYQPVEVSGQFPVGVEVPGADARNGHQFQGGPVPKQQKPRHACQAAGPPPGRRLLVDWASRAQAQVQPRPARYGVATAAA